MVAIVRDLRRKTVGFRFLLTSWIKVTVEQRNNGKNIHLGITRARIHTCREERSIVNQKAVPDHTHVYVNERGLYTCQSILCRQFVRLWVYLSQLAPWSLIEPLMSHRLSGRLPWKKIEYFISPSFLSPIQVIASLIRQHVWPNLTHTYWRLHIFSPLWRGAQTTHLFEGLYPAQLFLGEKKG